MPYNIQRHRVHIRQKQQEARENGQFGILFFLICMGFFLFAGNTVLMQMKNLGTSLRQKLSQLFSKNKGELAESDPLKKMGEVVRRNDKVLEEVTKNVAPEATDERD